MEHTQVSLSVINSDDESISATIEKHNSTLYHLIVLKDGSKKYGAYLEDIFAVFCLARYTIRDMNAPFYSTALKLDSDSCFAEIYVSPTLSDGSSYFIYLVYDHLKKFIKSEKFNDFDECYYKCLNFMQNQK